MLVSSDIPSKSLLKSSSDFIPIKYSFVILVGSSIEKLLLLTLYLLLMLFFNSLMFISFSNKLTKGWLTINNSSTKLFSFLFAIWVSWLEILLILFFNSRFLL